jgi:hypothetical protein
MYRALALAMLGRFDEGRPLLAETRAELAERGGGIRLAVTTGIESVNFELLAGDPTVAAELGAQGCRLLEEMGDKSFLSTAAGAWRGRSSRSIGSRRPMPGPAGRRRSARAKMPSRNSSGVR